ncbi:MAG: hypothetical protein PHI97_29540 [Desulfobulbus sp.]|nr:hypothetical protein [Desulfobulbus sp.]
MPTRPLCIGERSCNEATYREVVEKWFEAQWCSRAAANPFVFPRSAGFSLIPPWKIPNGDG